MKAVYLFIIAFFIGAIPSGYLITKVFHKKDIRNYGSGNIGFANVWRTVGIFSGIIVLLIDVGKAFVFAYYFPLFFENASLFRLLFSITIILGNIFNPFLKFKGGKGVATGLGVAAAVNPFSVLFSLAAFLIVILTTKYISLGSLTGAGVYLVSNILFYFNAGKDIYSVLFAFLLFIAILLRHISNIKRLIRGEENKIGFKKQ
jgi:glycerol-3-phosphate acyltransferase PlsY